MTSVSRVALWGDVGSGKDTWAATLHLAVEKSGLFICPCDATTTRWQADTRARMALGDFPRATDVPKSANELNLLTYELSNKGAGVPHFQRKRIIVQIPQAAGGWWCAPQKYQELHLDTPDPYQYLAYSSGIICLLDPTAMDYEASAVSLMTMLDYLDLYRRRVKQRQPLRIALWLTKMDHPQHRQKKKQEEAYARHLFGSGLANFVSKYSRSGDCEFRWGGCSAVGIVLHEGRMRSNVYMDYSVLDTYGNPLPIQRILAPKSIQPEDVLEPLRWVAEPYLNRSASVHPFFANFLPI